jgi:uncharacterized protein YjiS (DUF1127 family)
MSNRLVFGQPVWLEARQHFPTVRGPTWAGLRVAWRRYRSRQSIADLDAHILKDIGVSLAEAEAEANKPFWRE